MPELTTPNLPPLWIGYAHGFIESAVQNGPLFRNFMRIQDLEAELDWLLGQGVSFIGFEAVLAHLKQGHSLPPKACHLMFDDGYHSVARLALPLLKARGIPFSVALVGSYFSGQAPLWFDLVFGHLSKKAHHPLQTKGSQPESEDPCRYIHQFKTRPDKERREILARIDSDIDTIPLPDRPLDNQDILRLKQWDVTFLAHSMTHPILSRISDRDTLTQELTNWAPELLHNDAFVYPYGGTNDFNHSTIEHLKEAGYSFAFTTVLGSLNTDHDSYQLPRICLQPGLPKLIKRLRKVAETSPRGGVA